MKRNRLLKSQHQDVLNMFETGISRTRIADSMNVPVGAVGKLIRERFPDFEGRRYLDVKTIIKEYKGGDSVSTLADRHKTTIKTIQSRLLDAGIELRPMGEERRIHFFNEDFFEMIDTEEKAYWLGFMFADGCVASRMNDVSIVLSTKDRGHLQKFLAAIDYNGPGLVKDYIVTKDGVEVKYSKISLRSVKMCQDLVDKGCIPMKSLDVGPPEILPEWNNDFIRGLTDGDGYISKSGYPSLEIVGSYRLLEWVADKMVMPEPRPHKNIWRVRLSGPKSVEAMTDLYSGSAVHLDRKYSAARRNYE